MSEKEINTSAGGGCTCTGDRSILITEPASVTPEWLTDVLRRSGCLSRGRVIAVHHITALSYSSTLVRLSLTFSLEVPSSAPARLFLKVSRPDADQQVVGRAQRRKEVMFHNCLAPQVPDPPVVRCHHAVYDEVSGASHILLDDVSATHAGGAPFEPPAVEQAGSAMDALAAFHAFWWDHPALNEVESLPTDQSMAQVVAHIRERFPDFACALQGLVSPSQRAIYDRVLAALPDLWQRVVGGQHLTLIHGDANFLNVMLPRDPYQDRALLIDWQLYGVSFAAEDLAHLMPLFWDRVSRQRMEMPLLQRYHRGLQRHGVRNYNWEDCWMDYLRAVLLRTLFMPMWFYLSGATPEWWQRCLTCALDAVEGLHCLDTLEIP
jgi:hypothetical protein